MNDTSIEVRHLCPLPHRGHAPQIDPPATICHTHTATLSHTITDITRLWDTLDDLATTARTGTGGCGFNSQAPVRLDILALTDPHTTDGDIPNATAILTALANWIAGGRHLTPVAGATAALSLLRVHYPALTDHPHPCDAYSGLQRLHAYLRRMAGEHRHIIATCQQDHPDPQIDDECGGPLFWNPHSETAAVACADCGDSFTAGSIRLAMQQLDLAITRVETA